MSPVGGLPEKPVRVLIVDDTKTARMLITAVASRDPRIKIVGEAADPIEAVQKLKALNPDVMTLDVEMPRMNGLTFLEKVLRLRPLPVVMVSSHTSDNSDTAVKALALGAFECFDVRRLRPSDPAADRLVEVLVAAARSRKPVKQAPPPAAPPEPTSNFRWNGKVVVIGSSTGGVETLIRILSDFPANCPPTVIAQHMPKHFLESFARRLGKLIAPHVALADEGMELRQGIVVLGRGGEEQVVFSTHTPPRLTLIPRQRTDVYSPSVDALFTSAVRLGRKAVAVQLTGMGRDGADAMLQVRLAGGHTIAQSGETAVVDGMPRAAREIGAAVEVVPLPDLARHILSASGRLSARTG